MSFFDLMQSIAAGQVAGERVTLKRAVAYTDEFKRIEALPVRDWKAYDPSIQAALEQMLALPGCTMHLWPAQAAAIYEAAINGGAFVPIGVGQGKALVSLLAPVAMEAKRPLLLVPAQLRDQTKNHVIPAMSKLWRLHPGLVVMGYEELSLEKNAKILDEINPDLIILDECHRVKNMKAGRTRRLTRWFREHPETRCVAMSGTISKRSISDFAHIIFWCLRDRAPLPNHYYELTEWAGAIDADVPEEARIGRGALGLFGGPDQTARECYRNRFLTAPGVIATEADDLGVSLRIEPWPVSVPSIIDQMMHNMIATWERPDGEIITEAVELWRHCCELSLGFYYKWDPIPPKEWLAARKAWKQYARETLKNNRRGLDTEKQVASECARLDLPTDHPWLAWSALRDTFEPNTVPVWVDDFAVKRALQWLETIDNGICWVHQTALAQGLAAISGKPFFGAGDDGILDCTAPVIIAKAQAHSEGKNLQRYSNNLVCCPMSSGVAWEQLLARTHRAGQEADEVTCAVMLHTEALEACFEKARADARYIEATLGNRQKLNYADIIVPLHGAGVN